MNSSPAPSVALAAALAGLRRALWRALALEAGLVAVALMELGAALAIGMGVLLPGWARAPLIGAAGVASAALIVTGVWLYIAWLRRPAALAGLAERLAPELGSAVSSAVAFAGTSTGRRVPRHPQAFSASLAMLHIAQTRNRVQQAQLATLLWAARRRWRWAWGALATAMGLLAALTALLLPAGWARLRTAVLHPEAPLHSATPLVGDIALVYTYPPYSGCPARAVSGSDGSLRALVGTEVAITARSPAPPQAAYLSLAGQQVPLVVGADGELHGKLTVQGEGAYRFALRCRDGTVWEEAQAHPIVALPDAPPRAYLDLPKQDRSVRASETLAVQWRASDDFGLSEVALCWEVQDPNGAPPTRHRRPLLAASDVTQARHEGTLMLPMAELPWDSQPTVRLFVEAVDNDAYSSPKRAESPSVTLTLLDPQRAHALLWAQQQELIGALVDALATLLAPKPQAGDAQVPKSLSAVQAQLTPLLKALQDDRLTPPATTQAFTNLAAQLQRSLAERRRHSAGQDGGAQRSPTAQAAAALASAHLDAQDRPMLERTILYLDDLLSGDRIAELRRSAADVLSAQQRVAALLRAAQGNPSAAQKAAIQRQLSALRGEMAALMARMGQIRQALPSEHRNIEAAGSARLQDDLHALDKSMEEGDMEGAAAQLERLGERLTKMAGALDDAQQQSSSGRYAPARAALSRLTERLKSVQAEQRDIAARTEALYSAYQRQAQGPNSDAAARARAAVKAAQAELAAAAPPGARSGDVPEAAVLRERLDNLSQLLRQGDFSSAAAEAPRAADAVNALAGRRDMQEAARRTGQQLATARAALTQLLAAPERVLDGAQLQRMAELGRRQGAAAAQAQAMQGELQEVRAQLPLWDSALEQRLSDATAAMQGAQRAVSSAQLGPGVTQQKRALQALKQVEDALRDGSEKGGGGGSGAGSQPMPVPGGASPNGHGNGKGQGPGGPDTGNGAPGGDPRQGGEEVQIPAAAPSDPGPRFRQELFEAAKQRSPRHFEKAVRRYYEELIR